MKRYIIILICLLVPLLTYSTHNRAGEITYRHISGLTYEITIITYTYTASPADRPELSVSWGDGIVENVKRTEKISYAKDISRNTYIAQHTYPGPAEYVISFEDPNRNGGVLNIPNSVNVPFYIETKLMINPFIGINNSPILLNPPVDNACLGVKYIHNPGAYDIDGDSLSYKLVYCRGEGGNIIPGYSYPYATNSFSINSYTGDLIWDSPAYVGEYNVAIEIEEWRYGVKIGSVVRDMQITVVPCNNNPPELSDMADICVVAGGEVKFSVKGTDVDNNNITLTGWGGPFVLSDSPAKFMVATGKGSVESNFYWQTKCSHVQKQPYLVVFKVTDNGKDVSLSDVKNVRITVIGPPPVLKSVTPKGNSMILKWDSYECPNAKGYMIYRKDDYYGYIHDSCETGVPLYTGYKLIKKIEGINDTFFVDDNDGKGLIPGITYCYIMIAYFEDGAESYASVEMCSSLKRDVPIITNVSVLNTDKNNGQIYLCWSTPKELDTTIYAPPYRYIIYRKYKKETEFNIVDTLDNLYDTSYVDININTVDTNYLYKISFYNIINDKYNYIGTTQVASSIYLRAEVTDNKVILKWDFDVPWKNANYVLYKKNDQGIYDSIVSLNVNYYEDDSLANGKEYCYLVKSIGGYNVYNIVDPIINMSEEKCAIPYDNVAPCAPDLYVITNCKDYSNKLYWTNPNNKGCADDVIKYNIYYSRFMIGNMDIINSIYYGDTVYEHTGDNTISGCYVVTAVDTFGNESNYSNKICVDIDSCPEYYYRLPNVFTPDGDNKNDLYTPFVPYGSVEKIKFKVYNRWGEKVFETETPNIYWDGRHYKTGVMCSEGVYYYVCDIYEVRLEGIKIRNLHGFFHLIKK